jgi:hypothetical protein
MNLVGFITKKFVTMHGHMNVKFVSCYFDLRRYPTEDTAKNRFAPAVRVVCQTLTKLDYFYRFHHKYLIYTSKKIRQL